MRESPRWPHLDPLDELLLPRDHILHPRRKARLGLIHLLLALRKRGDLTLARTLVRLRLLTTLCRLALEGLPLTQGAGRALEALG